MLSDVEIAQLTGWRKWLFFAQVYAYVVWTKRPVLITASKLDLLEHKAETADLYFQKLMEERQQNAHRNEGTYFLPSGGPRNFRNHYHALRYEDIPCRDWHELSAREQEAWENPNG